MWFPSHVILYCWLNGTALQGHRVSRNWTFTDCTVQWSWLHPGQQLFPQSHMWLSITPHWIPHWGVCEAAHNGAACEVLALSHVPQEGTALLSHSTGRAKEPFSNWCKLVKPSTFSYIPLRLKHFFSLRTDMSSHWFTLPQILQDTFPCFSRMIAHLHNQLQDKNNKIQ